MKVNFSFLMLMGSMSLILLFSACKTQLEVVKATQKDFFGGAAGSGGGTRYALRVKKPAKMEVRFARAWYGDREKGKMFKEVAVHSITEPVTWFKNQTAPEGVSEFMLEFAAYVAPKDGPPRDQQDNDMPMRDRPELIVAPHDLPAEFTKGAILWYEVEGGKSGWLYAPEGDFEKLETDYMP